MPDIVDQLEQSAAQADETASKAPAGSPTTTCGRPNHYVEVFLRGEDDRGIADQRYLLKLPDGRELSGRTDADGRIYVDGFEADSGHCRITFPDLDGTAWEAT